MKGQRRSIAMNAFTIVVVMCSLVVVYFFILLVLNVLAMACGLSGIFTAVLGCIFRVKIRLNL